MVNRKSVPELRKCMNWSRSGRTGLPVPNSPYGFCWHKAALNLNNTDRAQELCESRGGRSGLPGPNSPYGLRGCKAALNLKSKNLLFWFPAEFQLYWLLQGKDGVLGVCWISKVLLFRYHKPASHRILFCVPMQKFLPFPENTKSWKTVTEGSFMLKGSCPSHTHSLSLSPIIVIKHVVVMRMSHGK